MYHGNKVKLLNIMLPKTSAYVKSYDGKTKYKQTNKQTKKWTNKKEKNLITSLSTIKKI